MTKTKERKRKTTLKEKKAYASGYSQAYQDCFKNINNTYDRMVISTLIGTKALLQLLNPKTL